MMKSRLKYYGLLILVIGITFAYLLVVFTYNWYIGDYGMPRQVVEDIISRNGRWVTWGMCGGGFGLLLGFFSALWLLIVNSDKEFFEEMNQGFQSFIHHEAFPRSRAITLFAFLVILVFILINKDWQLGLRNGLEVLGVIVWVIFLIASFILIPTLLVDLFIRRLFVFILDYLSKKEKK